MAEPHQARVGDAAVVVVPERSGPLIRLGVASGRDRDDLDELIDELFPDADDQPSWFDVGLIVVGLGVLVWGTVGGGPIAASAGGAIAAALGCVLPARSAWRRVQKVLRARHRSEVLARGVPMRLADPSTRRLVRAYDALCGYAAATGATSGGAGIAAGHSALLDAASLLQGRAPGSAEERAYVEQRATAIEELTTALRGQKAAVSTELEVEGAIGDIEPAALLWARREVDAIAGFTSLARLAELTAELRMRHVHG